MNIHPEKTEGGNRRRGSFLLKMAVVILALMAGLGIARSLVDASPQNPPNLDGAGPHYLNPTALKLSPGGQRLYVVCAASNLVLVVDTHTRRVVGRFSTGAGPASIAISPNGKTLYVSNELTNSVSEFDAGTLRVLRTFKAGWGPVGITTDQAGKFLYTANTLGDDISVIDLSTGKETKRLAAGHFPEYVDLSHDGKWIYVSNIMARLAPPEELPVSELTVVDTARQIVTSRIPVPGAVQLRHIAQVPAQAGGYLLIPFQQPHNLVPLVQIQQGWYLTNGMAIVGQPQAGQTSKVKEVLLDDIDRYYADGFGAASTPDGRWALVTASGANAVSIIDVAKLNRLLKQASLDGHEDLAHRLDSAQQFVVKRLATGRNPTAVVVSPDSHFAYIANRTDDTVSVIDLQQLKVASTVDLGGPKEITALRRGEQLFYDATFCYQSQLACASCHPHNGFEDGLVWSLETPDLGHDIV
ncbi:MAG: beta-propeller fold lactonase family protein, partial [Terriglobia bacterium]